MMKITGHRGAKDEWPENTLLAISKAIQNGVKAVEIDIHKTIDGELAVIHDSTLERTTNGKGFISEKSLEELRKLDAGMGEKIPTLEEVIDLTSKEDIHLFIEVKVPNVTTELIRILKDKNAYNATTVISFDHRFVKELKSLDQKIHTGCLMVGIPAQPQKVVSDANANMFIVSTQTVDAQTIKLCHENEIKVAVWNVNTKEEFLQMKAIKADYIMTDYPSLICGLDSLTLD